MEEKILEIIKRERSCLVTDSCIISPSDVASEITAHVFEFIEWLTNTTDNPFAKVFPLPNEYVNFEKGSERRYDLNDLYEYWLTKITIS